jgi:hypothetical protein
MSRSSTTEAPLVLRDPLYDVAVRLGLGFRVAQLHHLRNGPISRVQLDIALSTLAQLTGPQDFWWPVVTGLSRMPRALVIEDTWGGLARCLATRCDRVCVVFRAATSRTRRLPRCSRCSPRLRKRVRWPPGFTAAAAPRLPCGLLVWERRRSAAESCQERDGGVNRANAS